MFFSGQEPKLRVQFMTWWNRIPIFTYFMLYFLILIQILSFFSFYRFDLLILTPIQCINNLITFQYQHGSVLSLVIVLFAYLPMASTSERKLGSINYFLFFIINNILIGFAHIMLMYVLSLIPLSYFYRAFSMSIFTLWPIIMVEIVIESNKDPNKLITFCCFPWAFKSKYYP